MKLYAICWRDPSDGHNWAPAVGDPADFHVLASGLPDEAFYWDRGKADSALAAYLAHIAEPWGEWSVQEYDVPEPSGPLVVDGRDFDVSYDQAHPDSPNVDWGVLVEEVQGGVVVRIVGQDAPGAAALLRSAAVAVEREGFGVVDISSSRWQAFTDAEIARLWQALTTGDGRHYDPMPAGEPNDDLRDVGDDMAFAVQAEARRRSLKLSDDPA